MKLQKLRSGFTLIELLVVITIIGILATGAVNVYTSQIQKARDATRITDLGALRTGLEQVYQDSASYPNAGLAIGTAMPSFGLITSYVPKLPADPKTGQKAANTNFDYVYTVAADTNAITGQIFEVSTSFENSGNITEKAAKDGGLDNLRLESGISLGTLLTTFNLATPPGTWVNTGVPVAASCITAAGTALASCPTTASTTTVNAGTLVIR